VTRLALVLLTTLAGSLIRQATPASAPANLLDNPDAILSQSRWLAFGDAKIGLCGGDPCFVVRNHGTFQQVVTLPADSVGKFLVLIGSGSSERINPDGAITGLPYLYALVEAADGRRILAYLQGQQLLGRATDANAWVTMSGVFALPEGAARVVFDLNQAERRDVPQNGSAARFDHLGLYLFASESEARAFIEHWKGRDARLGPARSGMVRGIPHHETRGRHGRRGHATTGFHEGVPAQRPA
jgi:hypothetical protein